MGALWDRDPSKVVTGKHAIQIVKLRVFLLCYFFFKNFWRGEMETSGSCRLIGRRVLGEKDD